MNVYQIVTERIIKEMEKGVVPWGKPWICISKQNFKTRKPYHGINRLLLAGESEEYYLSFNQMQDMEGRLKKGAKSRLVIFWKPVEVKLDEEKDTEEKPMYALLRYYRVFRLCDTDGIPRPEEENNNKKLEDIETFIKRVNPNIEYGGSSAHYNPKQDRICIPRIGRFEDTNYYYSTLLHELIHWTGRKDRLNRFNQDNQNYHSEYGKEELTAEIGSAIICHHFGISLPNHNAGYIQNWLKAINGDTRLLIGASSRAEKAIEFLDLEG